MPCFLELELWTVMSCHVGAINLTWVLCKGTAKVQLLSEFKNSFQKSFLSFHYERSNLGPQAGEYAPLPIELFPKLCFIDFFCFIFSLVLFYSTVGFSLFFVQNNQTIGVPFILRRHMTS